MYDMGDFVRVWKSKIFGTVTDAAIWDDLPDQNVYYRIEDHTGREYWFNEDELRPALKIEQFMTPYFAITLTVLAVVLFSAFLPH